jgi:formaldehyde-activating enzyme involved in methanogenesis
MSLPIVTTATMIQCPHGIPATLMTATAKVLVDGMPPLVMGDKGSVAGCPFTTPVPKPQPCDTILLTKAATKVLAENKPVLLMNPADIAQSGPIPQGPAIWGTIQSKVLAT